MNVKNQILVVLFLPFALGIVSCEKPDELEAKKQELASLREEAVKIQGHIAELEKEILEQDSMYFLNQRNSTLVTIGKPSNGTFVHKIDVRGSVASKNNVLVSSKVMGSINSIKSDNGRNVKKGDVIMTIDASILRNSIEELEAQLELATTLYEKQKKLWDQNIGTEVQYLQSKNNKETLEKRLKVMQAQLADYIVRAPGDGQINDLNLKLGESVSMGMPLFRVVGTSAMYIKANVSESYVGRFQIGDSASIYVPSVEVKTNSNISSIGRVINEENRTFTIEVDIPDNVSLARANQVSIVTLTDYKNDKAMTVPTKIIQFDNLGNFIYVAQMESNSMVAEKKYVATGKSYRGKTEISSGLTGDENIILEGYRDVSKGSYLKTADLAKS